MNSMIFYRIYIADPCIIFLYFPCFRFFVSAMLQPSASFFELYAKLEILDRSKEVHTMALIHRDQKQTCHRKGDTILFPLFSLCIFLTFCMLFFIGCSGRQEASEENLHVNPPAEDTFSGESPSDNFLLGIWNDESGLMEFTFSEGGSLSIKPLLGPAFSGNYSLERDRLLLSYSTPLGFSKVEFSCFLTEDGILSIGNARYIRQ